MLKQIPGFEQIVINIKAIGGFNVLDESLPSFVLLGVGI